MSTHHTHSRERVHEEALAADSRTVFGFWLYLMSDLVLFSGLFATYVVLRADPMFGSANGPVLGGSFVLIETLVLLLSSIMCGIALYAARSANKRGTLLALLGTGILGGLFLYMECTEFAHLLATGNGWNVSGYLSAYFVLLGTHALHILIGLVWLLALMISISIRSLSRSSMRKLALWSMFWHFLDIVWLFIFLIVYLLPL